MVGNLLEGLQRWEDEDLPLHSIHHRVAAPTLLLTRAASTGIVCVPDALNDLGVAEVVVGELLLLTERAENYFVALFRQLVSYQRLGSTK